MQEGRLEITTKIGCTCNCKYCPQQLLIKRYFSREDIKVPETLMSIHTFKTCIDKLPKDIRIDFSGMAEPWLNPYCTDMLIYAHEKGHKIAVYTTLVGMQMDDFEKIKHIPFEEFVLHIPDAEQNTKITITDEYIRLLEKILDYKKNDGLSIVTGISCHGIVHPKIKYLFSENENIITELHDRAGNLESKILSKNVLGSSEIVCINCGSNLNHNVLLPDGTVLLCCMDYNMQHVLGNLSKETYDDICTSEVVTQLRNNLKSSNDRILCRNCVNAKNVTALYDEFSLYRNWVHVLEKKYVSMQEENKRLIFDYEKRVNEIHEYKDWVEKLKKEIRTITEECNQLNSNYNNRVRELHEYSDWVKNLEQQKEYLQADYDKLQNSYNERVKELHQYRDWVNNLMIQKDLLQQEYDRLISSYNERIKELHEYMDWVKKLNANK